MIETANVANSNSMEVEKLPKEHLEQLNNYVEQLLKSQNLLNDSWNKTKELVQDSVTALQIPAADIFQPARDKIKMEVSSFSKEDAENCTRRSEDQFIVVYHQVAESMLNCVSSKSRKVLISLIQAQDALQDGINRASAIQQKYELCQNKAHTEQAACQQMQFVAAQHEEAMGVQLISQAHEAIATADALPSHVMDCSEHILKYLRSKMPKIVQLVKDCVQNKNN